MQKELQDLQPQLIVTAEENSKLLLVGIWRTVDNVNWADISMQ